MHPYQTEDQFKTYKTIIALIVSVFAAYRLSLFLDQYPNLNKWWIDYPSVFGFFGIFVLIFDNFLWKLRPLQYLSFFRIPNINGIWDVEIKTSSDKFEEPRQGRMQIYQNA